MGASCCLSLLVQSKDFGHSWFFFQCFEDLFLWQRLAVIFVLEAAEILAGARGGFGGTASLNPQPHPAPGTFSPGESSYPQMCILFSLV